MHDVNAFCTFAPDFLNDKDALAFILLLSHSTDFCVKSGVFCIFGVSDTLMKGIFIFCFLIYSCGIFAQSSNPVGDAFSSQDNCYVVTSNIDWQLGAVWFNEQLNLADPFEIELILSFGNDDAGADGMVFVFQQAGVNALGNAGGGIGFEGFSPSLGIELDTFNNNAFFDLPSDHMAILQDGNSNHASPLNLAGPVSMAADFSNVEDGQDHTFKVVWDPTIQTLDVFFDCELRLTYTADIVETIFNGNGNVWWGFTGATGGESNLQTACISEFALGLQSEYLSCPGEEVQLGVVGAPDGTYNWTPATFLDDPTAADPISTATEDITYTVTFTDLCGDLTELQTVIDVVTLEVELPAQIIACEGEEVEVEAIGNGVDYIWSNGDEGNIITETEPGPLTVTSSIGECEVSASTELIFNPLPNPINLIGAEFCEGESAVLDATDINIASYQWSNDAVSESIEVTEGGTYEVVLTTNENCSETFDAEVIVNAQPDPDLPSSIDACNGDEVVLTSNSADSYEWSTGSIEQQITVTEAGNYAVTVVTNGCEGSDFVDVSFGTIPIFDLSTPESLCPDSAEVVLLPSDAYVWNLNGASVADSITFDVPGVYELTATDTSSFCTEGIGFEIEALENPTFEWPSDLIICDGVPLDIQLAVNPNYEVIWADGTEGELIQISSPGELSVTVTNTCSSITDQRDIIEARCDCRLFVPNSFTPNLDGFNELFTPSIDCDVQDYLFEIYNRWGELVFVSILQGEGWNGAAPEKSHYVIDGFYTWKVSYQVDLVDGVDVVKEVGHVIILR
jgi:gliding motility-associated-like protein